MIIDSHVHYAHTRYNAEFPYLGIDDATSAYTVRRADRDGMLADLKRHGICGFIEAGIRFDGIEHQREVVAAHADCMWNAIGVHPTRCHLTAFFRRAALAAYADTTEHRPVAIGEAGLDYHQPRQKQHRLKQKRWFIYQIKLAHRLELPLILHIRDAHRDALRILRRYRRLLHGGVVHCFRGDAALAAEYVALGFVIGIGGKLMGDPADACLLQDTVAHLPLSAFVVETDAPYVLPLLPDLDCSNKQWRKLCNSSLILPAVIRRMAEIRGDDPRLVEDTVLANTVRVFRLPAEGGTFHV